MDYAKPEVVVLGGAGRMVEQLPQIKGTKLPIESFGFRVLSPAYDLDE